MIIRTSFMPVAAPPRVVRRQLGTWWQTARHRQPTLAAFGLVMLLLMLPTLLALGWDDRMLRGVDVWAKPLKFMASVGLFSLTTAWLFGLVAPAARRSGTARLIVATIVVAASLEVGYITLQAALGEASHYNFEDLLHYGLYLSMGAGALALCITQTLLAWLILRHPAPDLAPAWRTAVLIGLALTLLLGAGTGGLLSSLQPPAGSGMPLSGWHGQSDLRPAHFLGIHAQQFLPLLGAWVARRRPGAAGASTVWWGAAAYVAVWAIAVAIGYDPATLTVPPPSLFR